MEHRNDNRKSGVNLAKALSRQMEIESDSIDAYYEILDCGKLSNDQRDEIIDIIADYKNHQKIVGEILADVNDKNGYGSQSKAFLGEDKGKGEEFVEPELEVIFLEGLEDKKKGGR